MIHRAEQRAHPGSTRMDPKSILITGCSSGIGLHAARELHRLGYRVFASARREEDVATLRAEGLTDSLRLDYRDSESIRNAVATVLEQTGGTLDALFNNGAYGQPGAVEDLSREALRAQLETNFFGWVELTNAVIPIMRQQGHGRIVHNSSILGLVAFPMRGAYTASKFALEAIADTQRLELHGTGIHISLIEPGPITTKFRDNALSHFHRHIDIERSPFQATYRKLLARLDGETKPIPFTLPPEAVTRKLIHALTSRRPKTRYYVTVPTTLFAYCKRWLPDRWLDALLRKVPS